MKIKAKSFHALLEGALGALVPPPLLFAPEPLFSDLRPFSFLLLSAASCRVVFLRSAVFCAGLLSKRAIEKNLIAPLLELDSTLTSVKSGEPRRRCSSIRFPYDAGNMLRNVNTLLDGQKK